MNTDVNFSKMNGLGNKIIVADMRGRADNITVEAALALAENSATEFDQIMELRDAGREGVDAKLRIINCDGSLAEACGNGTRCVVSWLAKDNPKSKFTFFTKAGLLNAALHEDGLVSVDMGEPQFEWQNIPLAEEFSDTTNIELQIGPIDDPILHTPSVASMGNPHCTFWVENDIHSYDLERFGPMLENHPLFPQRANITLARVVSSTHLDVRTWERGAGITLASGSSSCAALVNAVRKGFVERSAKITVPGGQMQIEWLANNHVMMTGPSELEFDGLLDAQTGEIVVDQELVDHE